MLSSKPSDFSNFPVCNNLTNKLTGGCSNIIEPHHIYRATLLCGCNHFYPVLYANTQRLFTKNWFSQSESFQCNFKVCILWAGNDYGFNFFIFHKLLPIIGCSTKTICIAIFFGRFMRCTANHF